MPPLITCTQRSVPFSCDKHTCWSDYLYAYIHGTCVLWVPTTLITFQPVVPTLVYPDTGVQQWSISWIDGNLYKRDMILNILYLENLHYCSVTSFMVQLLLVCNLKCSIWSTWNTARLYPAGRCLWTNVLLKTRLISRLLWWIALLKCL